MNTYYVYIHAEVSSLPCDPQTFQKNKAYLPDEQLSPSKKFNYTILNKAKSVIKGKLKHRQKPGVWAVCAMSKHLVVRVAANGTVDSR